MTRGAWLLGLLALGCARAPLPERTLRRFLELSLAGKTAAAWRMTAPSYREQCDLPCFTRVVAADRDELRRALADLRAGTVRSELRAKVALQGSGDLALVQRPGEAWQFAADPLDFYPQHTPEAALRSFLHALEARRYAVALRFVPQRLQKQVTEARLKERFEGPGRADLRGQIEAVKRHLREPLIIEGAEARLPVGDRREARLLLEDGRWYVLQLQ